MSMNLGGNHSSLADINVTPLVDVMLVLLVIFMVATPMSVAKKTKVKLPPVKTGQTLNLTDQDTILVLELDKKVRIYGCDNCQAIAISDLARKFKPNQRVQRSKQVYLYGDQRLSFRTVLKVMAQLRRAGVENVGLVTNPGGLKVNNKKVKLPN